MRPATFLLFALSLTATGCDLSLNRDLEFAAGAHAYGGTTINGRITVGRGAEISGDLRTVNGRIEVAAEAKVRDLNTINGSIRVGPGVHGRSVDAVNARIDLGEGAELSGGVSTVNGTIDSEGSARVAHDVTAVNGDILLRGTRVGGTVRNHLGDVRLLDGTLIEGDLELALPDHTPDASVSTVVIGVGAQVRGTLRAERPIRLFVHPTAKLGAVSGASPQPFQGTDVESN